MATYILMAIIAGCIVPVQSGINAVLGRHIGGAELSSLVSFIVGTMAMAVYVSLSTGFGPLAGITSAPLWSWWGGVLGAFFVTSTVFLAHKLGAGTMVALLVAGQMFMSLVLDHYGWLGFPQNSVSTPKIIGAMLIVAGVILIRR